MSQQETTTSASQDPLAQALALRRAGRPLEAEQICRGLLAGQPVRPDVLQLMAVIAVEAGRPDEAIQFTERALAIQPDNFRLHYNLGVALQARGRLLDAETAYRRALELKSDHVEAANNLGLTLRALERREEALGVFRRAIETRPSFPASHNNLGATLQELGRHDEAIEACKAAIQLNGDYAEAHNNLGNALRALGRIEEARAAFEKAAEAAPTFADARLSLGECLRALGFAEEAVATLRGLVELKPDFAEAHSNLAVALRELGNVDEAAAACRRAIALKPDFAEAHNNLGNLLHGAQRNGEALAAYERAIALKPDFADAWSNMGLALADVGRTDEAIAACRRAADLDPGGVKAHVNLATVLEEIGRTEEAAAEVERALAIDPDSSEAWFAKTDLKKFSLDDPDLRTLERLFAEAPDTTAGRDTRMALGFALGKAWMDAGDGDRALAHLDAANRLRRATITYDVEDEQRHFAAIAEVYTPELMARLGGAGDPSDLPIFIVGMPRSGTTLVEQILASHSEVHGAGELMALPYVTVGQSGPNERRPDFVSSLSPGELKGLGRAYLERVLPLAAGKRRLVDKMPGNFRHAGLIRLVLPNARVIHCRRDPIDTCMSCYAKNFVGRQDFSYDLGELGLRYRAYEALMAHWRALLPADRFIEVDYEQVVDDLEGQARRLLEFCGLGFEDACLNFHQTRRQVKTASVNQVRRPLYRTSVGRWKPFEPRLRPLIEALGPRPGDPAAARLYAEGLAEQRAKRFAAAEALYRRALELDPGHAGCLHQLGVIAVLAKRPEEAASLIGRSLALAPDEAVAHYDLGVALTDSGRHQEAAASFTRAAELKPDFAPAHFNLGNVLEQLGRNEEAIVAHRRAVELQPAFVAAHYNLGNELLACGRAEEAVAALKRAIELRPGLVEGHNNLGNAFRALDRNAEAAAAYRRALALKPDFALAQSNLGNSLRELGREEEAVAACRRALELAPNLPEAHVNLASALQGLGETAKALEAIDRALELAPGSALAWKIKSELKAFEPGDPDIERMEALLATADAGKMRPDDRLNLEFSLGKAFMDARDGERAFAHLNAGNRLKRASLDYDVEAEARHFDALAKAFGPQRMQSLAGAGEPSELPVFVVGMPRSGTTLIEQILASHSDVHGAGELTTLREVLAEIVGGRDAEADLTTEEITRIGRAYVERVTPLAAGKRRLVDKMPGNARLAGLIHVMLPNARIIHSRRDPVDTCLSCYTKNFVRGQDFSYDLKELGIFYRGYQRLMDHWRGLLPADRFIEVDYEEVVGDLEGQARRLVAFCGLDWQDACLEFHRTRRPVRTASVNQVRKPIYTSSVARWKPYATQLGPLIDALGLRNA